jgi:VanZ family protein
MRRVKHWWPAAVWAVAIFLFSTEAFSGEHTSRILDPLLRWLMPHATRSELLHAHFLVRKAGHVFVYFVFSVLLFRGARGAGSGWKLKWALAAWLIATAYSMSDEFHQTFVPGRGASPKDVLLDSTGAALAQVAVRLWRGKLPPSPE